MVFWNLDKEMESSCTCKTYNFKGNGVDEAEGFSETFRPIAVIILHPFLLLLISKIFRQADICSCRYLQRHSFLTSSASREITVPCKLLYLFFLWCKSQHYLNGNKKGSHNTDNS